MLGRHPIQRKHLSFVEDALDREDPNTFQDARSGHSSPGVPELPGISPLKKDAALEQAAQALGSGTHDALGAEALPLGSQTPGPGPSQANTTEISFPKNQVLDLNISDTMLQQPDGSSTPLPTSPKSASQAESTSAQSGSMEAVQVPEYLHKFCKKVLQDWNNRFPYNPMMLPLSHSLRKIRANTILTGTALQLRTFL